MSPRTPPGSPPLIVSYRTIGERMIESFRTATVLKLGVWTFRNAKGRSKYATTYLSWRFVWLLSTSEHQVGIYPFPVSADDLVETSRVTFQILLLRKAPPPFEAMPSAQIKTIMFDCSYSIQALRSKMKGSICSLMFET